MFILEGAWVEAARVQEENRIVFEMEMFLRGGVPYPHDLPSNSKIPGCHNCPVGGFCPKCYMEWKRHKPGLWHDFEVSG